LAAVLVVRPETTSVRVAGGDGRLIVETGDVRAFSQLVPALAQREGIRLYEVQPVDESLASVFSYLVSS
jgi:ABC-2 type transport system ATP-binding protein